MSVTDACYLKATSRSLTLRFSIAKPRIVSLVLLGKFAPGKQLENNYLALFGGGCCRNAIAVTELLFLYEAHQPASCVRFGKVLGCAVFLETGGHS